MRYSLSRGGATAALTAMLALAGDAGAEPPRPAALSWVRAPGAEACPAGQAIAAEVERVLAGAALVSIAQAEIVVEGRIEQRARASQAFAGR